jgi:hypothetical protein
MPEYIRASEFISVNGDGVIARVLRWFVERAAYRTSLRQRGRDALLTIRPNLAMRLLPLIVRVAAVFA